MYNRANNFNTVEWVEMKTIILLYPNVNSDAQVAQSTAGTTLQFINFIINFFQCFETHAQQEMLLETNMAMLYRAVSAIYTLALKTSGVT